MNHATSLKLSISVESAGYEDGNKAEIYLDGVSVIPFYLEAKTGARRGLFVTAVDQETAEVKSVHVYDTYEYTSENVAFQNFIEKLPFGTLVIIAAKDEASKYLDEYSRWLVESLGSTSISQLSHRDSWCLIGMVGASSFIHSSLYVTTYENLVRTRKGSASLYLHDYNREAIYPSANSVHFDILSVGFDSGNAAGMLINGRSILTTPFTSRIARGVNVAVISKQTGKIISFQSYDTHGDIEENKKLQDFLERRNYGELIALAIKDEGSRYLSRYSRWLLEGLGSHYITNIESRDSWALVAQVVSPYAIREGFLKRHSGSVNIRADAAIHKVHPSKERIYIRIFSTGFEDGNRAGIFVNGVSPHVGLPWKHVRFYRGLNVAIIDQSTGEYLDFQNFDTYGSSGANTGFRFYIKSIPQGRLVTIVVMDEASKYLDHTSRTLIEELGSMSIHKLALRDSWAFVGVKGGTSSTGKVFESYKPKGSGSAEIVQRNYRI